MTPLQPCGETEAGKVRAEQVPAGLWMQDMLTGGMLELRTLSSTSGQAGQALPAAPQGTSWGCRGSAVSGSTPRHGQVSQPGHLPPGLGSVPAFGALQEAFLGGTAWSWCCQPAFLGLPTLQTTDSPWKETAPRSPDRKIPMRARSSFRSTCKPTYTKLCSISNFLL